MTISIGHAEGRQNGEQRGRQPVADSSLAAGYTWLTKLTTGIPCIVGGVCDVGGAVDAFGTSVAVSATGGVIVIGAPSMPFVGTGNPGAAYVFLEPGRFAGGWSCATLGACRFAAKLIVPNANLYDRVGTSVAISADGNTIAVGAPGQPESSTRLGAVYVYTRPPAGWTSTFPLQPTATLIASDGGSTTVQNMLGHSVSVSADGSVIAAGAPLGGNAILQGGVYVFVRPAGGWLTAFETAELTASDALTYNVLGASVDISDDGTTIVAGASCETSNRCIFSQDPRGSAYVFVRPASGWTSAFQTARLRPSDGSNSSYGTSLSIAGNGGTVAVGATGASYVFTKPPSGWATANETARLTGTQGLPQLGGVSVSADGNTIAIGAVSYSNARVYLYGKPSAGWISGNETTQAVQSDGVLGDDFGAATALTAAGSLLVVGTPAAPARPQGGQGTSYVFGGSAAAPLASVAPSNVAFGPQIVGTQSAPQAVTMTNAGTAPLSVASVAVNGPFTATQNCFTASPIAPGASCVESLTFAPLTAGPATGTLTFTDDSGGASGATQQVPLTGTATKAASTASIASVSPNPAIAGQPVTVAFTVAAQAGVSLVPSGTVTVQASTGESCTGTAPSGSCALTFANAGDRTIAASYAGSDSFMPSVSSAVSVKVVNFTVAVSPATQSINGRKATYTLTISGLNGFAGTVSLACSGGPANTACSVNPASVTLSVSAATAPAKATVTLPNGAPIGTYTFTFTGTFSGVTRTATATLTVK